MRLLRSHHVHAVGAVAAGGVIGAEVRYLLTLAQGDHAPFPWATLVENVTGCFFIGVLMVVLTELTTLHRLTRPFLGVGVFGGYTTFSAYAVEIQQMLVDGRAGIAVFYLAVTPVGAILAVWAGTRFTQATLAWRRRRRGEAWG